MKKLKEYLQEECILMLALLALAIGFKILHLI